MPRDHDRQDGPDRDWLMPRDGVARPKPQGAADKDDGRRAGADGTEAKDKPRGSGGDDPQKNAKGGGGDEKDRRKGEKKGGDKGEKGGGKPDEPKPRWPFVVVGVVVVGFIAAVLWLIYRPKPDVWTDDAYVRVHYTSVAPRISGKVVAVLVEDDDQVRAGDVLMELDPRDYQTAVAAAEATVARDRADVGDTSATLSRQPALIGEQQAAVEAARARLAFAQADAKRYTNLASTGAGTNQQHQSADATLQQEQAQLDSAEAALEASKRQVEVLKAQRQSNDATVRAAEAQLEQARLNLSYTKILAPIDGMVGERSVQVGNYLSPGATVMALVPLDRLYIIANYLETDLAHVRGGQKVTIHVDAYDIDLDGTVDGVPPASGASFAPIEPNNATGNFTKITQRLPVKIDIVPGQALAKLLRVGFSVETTIHTGLEDVVAEQRNSDRRITAH